MVVPKPEDTFNVVSYRTPKQIILQIVKIGIAKSMVPAWQTLLLGFMAGCYIAVAGLLAVIVGGGLSGPSGTGVSNPSLIKVGMGAVFPLGLMLVVIAGSELFTGNTMFMIPAFIEKRITWKDVAKNWGLSYVSNFFGSVIFAYFMGYLCEFTHDQPYNSFIINLAEKKINAGWGVNFLRGIGCNWLVCMALFSGLAAADLVSKIVGLWWPIFAFVAIGFEHSVANMFFIPLGLMESADKNVGQFLWYNLLPVTLGNIIGGSIFVACVEWAAYQSYFGQVAQEIQPAPGPERAKKLAGRPSSRMESVNRAGALRTQLGTYPSKMLETPTIPDDGKQAVNGYVLASPVSSELNGAVVPNGVLSSTTGTSSSGTRSSPDPTSTSAAEMQVVIDKSNQ